MSLQRSLVAKNALSVLRSLCKAQVKAILGPDLVKTAKNGPKMLEVTATIAELEPLFGYGAFSKTLRYGASLDLVKVSSPCSAV